MLALGFANVEPCPPDEHLAVLFHNRNQPYRRIADFRSEARNAVETILVRLVERILIKDSQPFFFCIAAGRAGQTHSPKGVSAGQLR
ncbi:MAG: hypothetical protein ACKOUT_11000 [Novosphingobium sp.]